MSEPIDDIINIWSMRPSPNSEAGKAWEDGARQGWRWAEERLRARVAALEATEREPCCNLEDPCVVFSEMKARVAELERKQCDCGAKT